MTAHTTPPSDPRISSASSPCGFDWAAERGQKWRDQLAGMEAMLAPIDEPLIRALQLGAPSRIADLGCGGGGTALEILRRAPPGSVVHGFDLSPALIEAARARPPHDPSLIAFVLADVSTASPPAVLYDRLVSRFGIMFYPQPSAAFANVLRWLAPRGRFAFAVWGDQAENSWFSSVRDVVAQCLELPATEPDAPGAFRYAKTDTLLALLAQAGADELAVAEWRGTLAIGGGLLAPEAAKFALAAFSSFGELLAEAGGDALNRARRSLVARFSECQVDGAVRLDACVRIVTGIKSSA